MCVLVCVCVCVERLRNARAERAGSAACAKRDAHNTTRIRRKRKPKLLELCLHFDFLSNVF